MQEEATNPKAFKVAWFSLAQGQETVQGGHSALFINNKTKPIGRLARNCRVLILGNRSSLGIVQKALLQVLK